jgi:RNA polymerase sigma-70 factor (ECF subfamily)
MELGEGTGIETGATATPATEKLMGRAGRGGEPEVEPMEREHTCFWPTWSKHRNHCLRICMVCMKGNREEAEEALSIAMLRAWSRHPDHAARTINMRGWLSRLTYNVCMDIHRERSALARRFDRLDALPPESPSSIDVRAESPERVLIRHETYRFVSHAIDDLPTPLRQPFILRFVEEMSYPDIAEQLALTNANVRKRVQQARAILREQCVRYLGGQW